MFAAESEAVVFSDRRRSPRAPVSLDAKLGWGGSDRALCKVVDLFPHGARLQTCSSLRAGARIWLTLPRVGQIIARVIWADDFVAGCEFHAPLGHQLFDTLLVDA